MGRGLGEGWGHQPGPWSAKGHWHEWLREKTQDWGCPTLAWGTGGNRPLREPQDPQSYRSVSGLAKPALPLEACHGRESWKSQETQCRYIDVCERTNE